MNEKGEWIWTGPKWKWNDNPLDKDFNRFYKLY